MIYFLIILAILAAGVPCVYGSRSKGSAPPVREQLRCWHERDKSLRNKLQQLKDQGKL